MLSLIFFLRKTNPLQQQQLVVLNKAAAPSPLFSISSFTSRFFSSSFTNNKPKIRKHDPPPPPYKPTSDFYDQQITLAASSRDFTTLHRLLNQRAKHRCFNTKNTFKFLINNNNNENDPNSFFDQLLQTLSRLDKGSPRKSAFDMLIASLCKSHRIEETHRVINIMIQGNYGITSSTFHPLLNALTRKRRYNEAWDVLNTMRQNGIRIDITAYNYILTAHCFNGDLAAAAEVLEKIEQEEEGLNKEDQKVYDSMILGACRVGKVEGALLIFRRMEEARVSARYSTHSHIINGLMGLGYFAQAVEFVLAVAGRDERLDSESFGHLFNCLMKKKRVEEAKVVFEEMEKRGLKVGVNLTKDYVRLLSPIPSSSSSVVADCQSDQV